MQSTLVFVDRYGVENIRVTRIANPTLLKIARFFDLSPVDRNSFFSPRKLASRSEDERDEREIRSRVDVLFESIEQREWERRGDWRRLEFKNS